MILIINAIIVGIIWYFCYLYIRRYANPENNKDIRQYRMDAFYGGIASSVAYILNTFIIGTVNWAFI